MKIEIKRSNRKTMALHVRDGNVFVRAPYQVSDETIQSFIASRQDWIQKHLDRYRQPGYQLDEPLRVFGIEYPTQRVLGTRFHCVLDEGVIRITHPEAMTQEIIQKRVDDTFKKILVEYLEKQVPFFAHQLNKGNPPFIVRRYKRLHGRCMRNGELAFNTYLYHESHDFIDYVILHECAHLIEFNHSARFYALIAKIMPDYKQRIKQQREGRL